MARGGTRTGKPGKSYANRTDLNERKALPVQAPPSQQYGQRAALENAQRAVPITTPGGPAPMPPGPSMPGGPGQLPAGATTAQGAPAGQPALPPTPMALDAPTQRPDEPITAGLNNPQPTDHIASLFQQAAAASGSSALAALADTARQYGQ